MDEIGFVWTPPEGEGRKRGRKSKSEIEAEDAKRAIEIEGTENSSSPAGQTEFDDDDLDSFVASFDFSGTDSNEPPLEEDYLSPTWGFEAGADFDEVVAAAKVESAQQAAMNDYEPPQSLQDSLAAAKQRAIEVGIVQEG